MRIGERTTHDVSCIDAINRRADDGQQIGTESAGRTRQLTLFGSDQADNRVTKSNSLSSRDTTWSASPFAERLSTWEITLTSADSTFSMA